MPVSGKQRGLVRKRQLQVKQQKHWQNSHLPPGPLSRFQVRFMTGSEKTHVKLATGTSQLMSPAQPCFSAFPRCAAHSFSTARTAPAWPLHPSPLASLFTTFISSLRVAAARGPGPAPVCSHSLEFNRDYITLLRCCKVTSVSTCPHKVKFPPPHPEVVTSSRLSSGQLVTSPFQHAYHPRFTRNVRLLGEDQLCARPWVHEFCQYCLHCPFSSF